jgi:hypothetical protein
MNRERIPPGEFYDVLNAAKVEYASLSWSGFNVFGDSASIAEVQRLQHLAGTVPELRKIVDAQVETVKRLEAEVASWAAATERME